MELLTIILVLIFSKLDYALTLKNVKSSTVTESKSDKSTLCTEVKCMMKCCPLGKSLFIVRKKNRKSMRKCDHYDNTTTDFASLANDVFIEYPEISTLNFTIKAGIFEANETYKTQSINVPTNFNLYLSEYPRVFLELPNAYNRWMVVPNSQFCWDHKITRSRKRIISGIWVVLPRNPDEPIRGQDRITSGLEEMKKTELMERFLKITKKSNTTVRAMLVSCVFLMTVLVVYSLLPELRDLYGQILVAYVASLLVTFLLLAILHMTQLNVWTCRVFTFAIYFCFIASFCWLHVMSYDIWWTFRNRNRKACLIKQRNRTFEFLKYCLYAFGLPLVMTIALVVLNEMNMRHIPWFITPNIPQNGCFLEGGERLLYLNIPILILILCSWIFYLMTAINVWRLSRGTDMLDSAASGKDRKRLMIYLMLSAVMSLDWVLEIVSFMYPGYTTWFICDLYQMFIGVHIFLIFVWEQNIPKKLMKRYSKFKSEWRPIQRDSTSTLSTSTSRSGSSS